MVKYFVGLDLGQANDYTALSILERQIAGRESSYDVRRLERVRGASYPDIIQKVTSIMRSPPLAGNAALVVDQTGVGAPVVDTFRKARLKPVGVMIHGGDKTTQEGLTWRVPKRDLVGTLQVLLQNQRLKISWKLKLAKVLSGEMLNFKVKIDSITAHDSYSAWRESDHDDLLLATALAAWYGERSRPRDYKAPVKAVAYGDSQALEQADAFLGTTYSQEDDDRPSPITTKIWSQRR